MQMTNLSTKKRFLTWAGGLLAISLLSGIAFAKSLLMNGAGATFPYPIYSKWFVEYTKVDKAVKFNYQSIGSGGGIRQITAQTVDFGATDGPMTNAQLKDAPGEIFHIPTVAGAVVVAYNIPGVKEQINLTPEAVAGIFLGNIKTWNDPKIAGENKGIKFPSSKIVVAHRSDGSGTTYIFVDYLSSISSAWKKKVGTGTSVNWPVGLGGKGNEGVAGLIKQMPGAAGYVELAYAIKNDLPYAAIKNKAGKFIVPSIKTTTAAVASGADKMPSDFRVSLVNPSADDAYSIAGFTWLLVYKNQSNKTKGEKLVQFLRWAITDGQKYADDLYYAPLPKNLIPKIEKKLDQIQY